MPASVSGDPDDAEGPDPSMGQTDDGERDDDRRDRDEEAAEVQQRQGIARGLEDVGPGKDDRPVRARDRDGARGQPPITAVARRSMNGPVSRTRRVALDR